MRYLLTLEDLDRRIRELGCELTCKIVDSAFVVTAICPALPRPHMTVAASLGEALETLLRIVDKALAQSSQAKKAQA